VEKAGAWKPAKTKSRFPPALTLPWESRQRRLSIQRCAFSATAFYIPQIVCWQIERLKSLGLPVLLIVDEPAQCLKAAVPKESQRNSGSAALAAILEDARARRIRRTALLCRAPFRENVPCQTRYPFVRRPSGTRAFFADRFPLDFVHNGGSLAYGMVPTMKRPDAINAATLFTLC
jgi:hypothetical protein